MRRNSFSFEAEKSYYSQGWPKHAAPYAHLEHYLRCWLHPESAFFDKEVLDIGAGECTYTRLIAEKFRPKHIVACELFRERMLPAAQDSQNPILKFVAGNCLRLPFRDNSFDVVFGGGILSQLPNLSDAVSEIRRVLRERGIFVGWEPNPFNPVIAARYFFKPRSPNQYLFWPRVFVPQFKKHGLNVTVHYFYARVPRARSRFVGTCVGLLASRETELATT